MSKKPIKDQQPIQPKLKTAKSSPTSKIIKAKLPASDEIIELFNSIETQLDKKPGQELSIMLENLSDTILNQIGSSIILREIRKSSSVIKKRNDLLNRQEKEKLESKINFWKKRLNI